MAVKYVPYGSVRVSRRWNTVLRAADRAKVGFHVTSGHRTMAEQQALFNQNMHLVNGVWVPKPGRPLTAFPNRNAPHIRVGRADHAIDVDSLDGGETRLQHWLEKQGATVLNPVRGESWHMEIPAKDLERLARKLKPKPHPKPPISTSVKGVSFVSSFEGLRLVAYKAHPSERWFTIGYGHYGPDVHQGMRITKKQARELLKRDLHRFEQSVLKYVPERWRQHRYRFDALVSIAFNLGPEVLTAQAPLTSLGEALKGHDARKIAAAMRLYDKAGGETLPGLTRRRRAEARLFTSGNYSTK